MVSQMLPSFAEIYVVSDIHLGGEKTSTSDFQIFHRGPRLAGLIDQVAALRPDQDVALVLNGDIIDSLAEDEVPGYVALDAAMALRMMKRIYQDPSFCMVWDALEAFLAKPRRYLVVVLGNHDIELALPVVEADIRRQLGGADTERQSRLLFSTHGAGFACWVGKARVFCSHGNEVDPMNWVDYNLLGQLGNAIAAGRSGDTKKWKPNGGTRLVVDVMNGIKKNYPFVDLLKPETAAVAGVLVALDPDTFSKVDLRDTFPILKNAWRGHSVTSDLLGEMAGALPANVATDALMHQLLGPNLRATLADRAGAMNAEDDWLLQAGTVADGGRAMPRPGESVETLGAGAYVAGWLGLLPKVDALRRALQDWLADDKTYDVGAPTHDGGLFEQMKSRVGYNVDFTITGHTHLARALQFPNGSYYYNCGTWIRLLQLTDQVLESRESFERELWPVLKAGSMQALDQATIPGPGGRVDLLLDRTHAVRLSVDENGRTVGDLLLVTGKERAQIRCDRDPGTTPAVIG